jgi:hypothetical protein
MIYNIIKAYNMIRYTDFHSPRELSVNFSSGVVKRIVCALVQSVFIYMFYLPIFS